MIIHVHAVDLNGPEWHWYVGEDIHGILLPGLAELEGKDVTGKG